MDDYDIYSSGADIGDYFYDDDDRKEMFEEELIEAWITGKKKETTPEDKDGHRKNKRS